MRRRKHPLKDLMLKKEVRGSGVRGDESSAIDDLEEKYRNQAKEIKFEL
ncbi:MAG: hypothetical protein RBT65_07195 [Methanolobus sp.]|nr:hypothetical protein [Methanolobus sp.]